MSITRSEVIKRAATIWPLGHVPYSQMTVRNPGWRTDCSGYVSMCLDLPGPGLTTVTLVEDGTAYPGPMSTISGIDAHAGIADWHTPWDDPHNAGLRAHRTTPAHVQPGDAAWVPAP